MTEIFELTLMINGVPIKYSVDKADEEKTPSGWDYVFFTPKYLDAYPDTGFCEVCKAPEVLDYLVDGKMHELCAKHVGPNAIAIDIQPTLIPSVTPKPNLTTKLNTRQEAHNLMKQFEAEGLTRKQISVKLTSLGYKEVSERTVAKHLRGECSCFK